MFTLVSKTCYYLYPTYFPKSELYVKPVPTYILLTITVREREYHYTTHTLTHNAVIAIKIPIALDVLTSSVEQVNYQYFTRYLLSLVTYSLVSYTFTY